MINGITDKDLYKEIKNIFQVAISASGGDWGIIFKDLDGKMEVLIIPTWFFHLQV